MAQLALFDASRGLRGPNLCKGHNIQITRPWTQPIGTGPYALLSRERNDSSPSTHIRPSGIMSWWLVPLIVTCVEYKIGLQFGYKQVTVSPASPTTLFTFISLGFSKELRHVSLRTRGRT